MCKLSIIIPVYGVERFIEDCVLSCIENIPLNSQNVEVIVVDDGSKDRSMDILHKIVVDIPYIRILRQNNQGLSMARNNGLQIAKGDYVWFVDSDDFISVGIVDQLLDYINKLDPIDLFEIQYQEVEEFVDRNAIEPSIMLNDKGITIISGKEKLLSGFYTPVQFHIFRRKFLDDNGLRMYPGIYHEDSEFTPRAIWMAQNIAIIPEIAYYYRQRSNSIMSTVNPKKGHDCMFVAFRLQKFFHNQRILDDNKRIIAEYISMTYCNGLNNAVGATKEIKQVINKAAIEYKEVIRSLKDAKSLKYNILGYIASLFPMQITNIYLLMMKFK